MALHASSLSGDQTCGFSPFLKSVEECILVLLKGKETQEVYDFALSMALIANDYQKVGTFAAKLSGAFK